MLGSGQPEARAPLLPVIRRSGAAQPHRSNQTGYWTLLDRIYDLGPLPRHAGCPYANIAVAGRRMTAGSCILVDNVAAEDAVVMRRLKRAGAAVTGFTNMHEFARGGTT